LSGCASRPRTLFCMSDAPLLTITDAARQVILQARSREQDSDSLALWFGVKGATGGAPSYELSFRPLDDAGADDVVQPSGDLPVVVPGEDADTVRGSTLDLGEAGIVLRPPNAPQRPPADAAEPAGDLSSPIAQRVLQVLNEEINPAIAAHGGRADLVAVDESVAYLHLSGGCQGCGMASATLRQGIEVMIREAVPEITDVADVTDHASGTNPYFAPD
jgi:Fe/S biogenesis protein NfuA